MGQSDGGEGRLGGKVVVVTGGARGIGGAAARVAGQQGAKVVIGDVLAAEGEETAAAITADGGSCVFVQTDVSREEDCERLMAAAVEHYGRLDALIASAGILWGAFKDVDELDVETFGHVMDANVQGMFLSGETCGAAHQGRWRRRDPLSFLRGGRAGRQLLGGLWDEQGGGAWPDLRGPAAIGTAQYPGSMPSALAALRRR